MAPGRPRTFDVDQALDRALQVFWRKGYEGTSLAELTRAMGINPPSLYAAFGNKEALFRKALERYAEGRAGFWSAACQAPSARAVAERLLYGTADFLSDRNTPQGCLMVQGALTCGDAAEAVRRELIARRAAATATICRRFERARGDGDLPADVDPAELAGYLATVLEGMAVQAAAGASRQDLRRIAGMALRVWPT